MVYSTENVGGYDRPDLPESVIAQFRELNALDYAIYAHALEGFEARKRAYGPTVEADVDAHRESLKERL